MMPIAFSSPWFFIALPVVGWSLMVIYRRRERARAMIVSSLFLFQQLTQKLTRKSRFRPPLRFFLELVIFLLLIAAAAGLLTHAEREHVALVFDNSLSMAARNREEGGSASLFEQAKSAGKTLLRSLPPDAAITVYETAPRLQVVASGVPSGEALQAISRIPLVEGASGLAAGISVFARTNFKAIHIFTDANLVREGSWSAAGSRIVPHPFRLEQGDSQNLTISRVEATTNAGTRQLLVGVQNFSPTPLIASIQIEGIGSLSPQLEFMNEGEKRIAVPANGTAETFFGVDGSPIGMRVSAKVWRDAEPQSVDSLREDDFWYVQFQQSTAAPKIGVLSPKPFDSLGLKKIQLFSFLSIKSLDATSVHSLDGLVLDKVALSELPTLPSVVIAPVGDSFLGQPLTQQRSGITSIENSHAIVQYINPLLLSIPKSLAFQVPAWGEDILSSSEGSLLFAGTQKGNRYSIIGFELLPFAGPKARVPSILLLNTLKWTLGEQLQATSVLPGSLVRIPDGFQNIHNSSGETLIEIQRGGGKFVQPTKRGFLVASGPDGASTVFASVNGYFPEESNLQQPEQIVTGPSTSTAHESAQQSPISWTYLLAAISLLLLAVDTLVFDLLKEPRSQDA